MDGYDHESYTRKGQTEPTFAMYYRETKRLGRSTIFKEHLHDVSHRLTDEQVHDLISQKNELLERAAVLMQDMDHQPQNIDHVYRELFNAYKNADFTDQNTHTTVADALNIDLESCTKEGVINAEKRAMETLPDELASEEVGFDLAYSIDPSLNAQDNDRQYEHRGELRTDRDFPWDDLEYYEQDIDDPSEFLFECYLNEHLKNDQVDHKVVKRYEKKWTCLEGYNNPIFSLIEIIANARIHVGNGITYTDFTSTADVPYEAWRGQDVYIEKQYPSGKVSQYETVKEAITTKWSYLQNKEEYEKIAQDRNEHNKRKFEEYTTTQEPDRKKRKLEQIPIEISPALLASYLRVLKLILDHLEEMKPTITPREYSMWCRVIPHVIISEFGVYTDDYFYELESEFEDKNYWYDSDQEGSEEWRSEASNEESDEIDLFDSDEEREDVENGLFATMEEIESHQSAYDVDTANRWLHIDTSETETIPIIYHDWHEKIDTEEGPALVDISGIESIDVRSQINEPVDEELPPSLHLDLLRVLRKSGVRGETPFAIAEGFFSLREYIHNVLKQVILQNMEQGEATITKQDIENAVRTLQGYPIFSSESILDQEHDVIVDDVEESSVYTRRRYKQHLGITESSTTLEIDEILDAEQPLDKYENLEQDDVEYDLSFELNMIALPRSTFEEDILSENCIQIVDGDVPVSSTHTRYSFGEKSVVALNAIITIRCNLLPIGGIVNIQEQVDAETFYDYLCYLFTTDQDSLFEHDKPERLEILQQRYPLNKDATCDLNVLLHDTKYTDFTIQANGHSFQVHKSILSARSEYFTNMFGLGLSESSSTDLDLSDVIPSERAGKYLQEYIYNDTVELTVEEAMELLPVAHYLMLQRLTAICELCLARNLTEENAEGMFRVAMHFESQKLFKLVESFIVHNSVILNDEAWSQEEKRYFESIREPIDTVNVVEKLENAMKQIQEQVLDKYLLNRLEKFWKHQYVQIIARNYDYLENDIERLDTQVQEEIKSVIVDWGLEGDGKDLIVPQAEINLWAIEDSE